MKNFPSRFSFEHLKRQQANQVITFNKISFLIPEETAVKITIPGNTKICASFNDGILSNPSVLY